MTNASTWAPGAVYITDPSDGMKTQRFVATASQKSFTLTNFSYTLGRNALQVYKNGLIQAVGVDYEETSTTTFSLYVGCTLYDVVYVVGFTHIDSADITAAATAFNTKYLGAFSTNPTVDGNGGALVAGAMYYNIPAGLLMVYNGATFIPGYAPVNWQVPQNLTFVGASAPRIVGDFSAGTSTNRVHFQSSVVNGNTSVGVIPNGTGTQSGVVCSAQSDSDNSSRIILRADSTAQLCSILSAAVGTATYYPLAFFTSATERLRIDTDGSIVIGGTTTDKTLYVYKVSATSYAGIKANAQGDLVTTLGTASPSEALRVLASTGTLLNKQPAPAVLSTSQTMTLAHLLGKLVISSPAAAITLTLPTGATVDAGILALGVDMALEFSVINTSAFAVNIAVNTGITAFGALTVAANTSSLWKLRKTAGSTFILYRIA